MKSVKGFALGLILGLGVALGGLAFAQNTNDQNKKADSCCATASCCCCGESCAMKEGAKAQSDKQGCCCCGGESCNMKDMNHMKDMKNKPQ